MNEHLKKYGLQEQAGFMKDLGCSSATSILKMTLQHLQAANQDSFILFMDIISVNREMLWKILEKYGIPEKVIATIKKMYTNINIKLSIEDAELIFKSISGVKQGDNLAPILLFLFVVQAAVETMVYQANKNA
jgi:uroporphyrinogen-III decarboxylase